MKKELVQCILAVFFLSTMPVFAQESLPTDDIVVKATKAVIFQMTVNLKLTPDQTSAVGPIIADNIAKVRNLQQRLENGVIDGGAMYSEREKLMNDEDQELGAVLSPGQMRVWRGMQNEPDSRSRRNSK